MVNQQYTNICMLLEMLARSERRPSFFPWSGGNPLVVTPGIDDALGRLIGRHVCHKRLI
jgi:hypothetical protein